MGRKTRPRLRIHQIIIMTAVVILFYISLFYGSQIFNWLRQNLQTIITVVLLLAALTVVGALVWINIRGDTHQRLTSHKVGIGRKSRRRPDYKGYAKWFAFIILMVIVILTLMYGIPPLFNSISDWFRQNIATIITVALSLAALAVIGALVWINRGKIASSGSGGGTCLDDYTWRPQNMNDPLALAVWQSIIDFKCKTHYELERLYHHELFEWLQRDLPPKNWSKSNATF